MDSNTAEYKHRDPSGEQEWSSAGLPGANERNRALEAKRAQADIEQAASREELLLAQQSKENVTIFRTLRSEWRRISLSVLALILVNMLAYSFPQTLWRVPLGNLAGQSVGLVLPILGFIPLFLLLSAVRGVHNERYIIGPRSVIRLHGLASFATTKREIYHGNIRAVEIEQGVIQRMLGVGDLKIGDLFSSTSDIVMRGIRNPEQVKGVLERRLNI